jgi:hypothetical protein
MSTATEETALATRDEFSTELAPSAAVEAARQEVQAAIIVAKRFPRNEDAAFQQLMKSCQRPTFAGDVTYSFPRGKATVTGPTIYLAREFARLWGNIRHGCDVVAEDDEERTIRAWAWDLQTNVKVSHDVTFKKLIQRSKWVDGEKTTAWIEPDERDLRELTNKHAAIAKRNCLLELLPSDMVEDAIAKARETLLNKATKDPDELRKNIITGFGSLNVSVENLEAYLGHKISECTPAELVDLRGHYKSIKDGNATWGEIAAAKVAAASKSDELADRLDQKGTPSGANGQQQSPAPPSQSDPQAAQQAPTQQTPPPSDNGPIRSGTVKTLRSLIKQMQMPDTGAVAALVHLGIRKAEDKSAFDLTKLSEDEGKRLLVELENPTVGKGKDSLFGDKGGKSSAMEEGR